ncbi:MAG: ABC transporter permease [Streptosporangiaceae bacterium]
MAVLDMPEPTTPAARLRYALADAVAVARRNVVHIVRVPESLADVTIQPVIFVLLFGFVFGSAINIPGGGDYIQYLMPALYVMTMLGSFAAIAVGMADDASKGIMDRFRSLPMARSAVLVGRSFANLLQSVLALIVTIGMGLAVGWRPGSDLAHTVAAFGLLLLLAFAMNWVGMFVGLVVRSSESANSIGMMVFLPLMFLANTFVPTGGMPAALRTIANWNPVSAIVAASRDLFGNAAAIPVPDVWPLQHPIVATVGWALLLLAVFVPLAVRRYRTAMR